MSKALFYFVLMAVFCMSQGVYRLRHISTEYLPAGYIPEESFEYNVDAAEQSAVDESQPIMYVVGLTYIHVVDFSTPELLTRPYHVQVAPEGSGELTDVETCGSWVAVGFDDFENPMEGKVFVYSVYNREVNPAMTLLHTFVVGSLPDMVKFTKDCSRLLAAVEGEVRVIDGQAVDPEGVVAIVTFDPFPGQGQPTMKLAGFEKFNDRVDEYISRGVRKVYNGQGTGSTTTFSQDLEPEYIAINQDQSVAYIILQENNAVATVDIVAGDVTELYSFGYSNYGDSSVDPSDMDGGINLRPWSVSNMPQPDGAVYIRINDQPYLLTANEGDVKEYSTDEGYPFNWSEAKMGSAFSDEEISDTVNSELRASLQEDSELGRLKLSTIDGKNEGSQYEQFYSYGSRSFSLYDINGFKEVYNSGDDMERRIAEIQTPVFNADPSKNDESPEETFDTRSDDRGPEPDSISYGEIDGDTLVFVGLERPGFIMIYSIDSGSSPVSMNFHSITYGGGYGRSWEQLYEDRETRDTGPEDIKFIPASRGIAPYDMLAVTGSYSGTISLYQIYNDLNHEPRDMIAYGPRVYSISSANSVHTSLIQFVLKQIILVLHFVTNQMSL